jgi:NitT/TauT family transport system ATP-binding protein
VRLAGIQKVYGTDGKRVHAVGPLSVELDAGEFVALIGTSGCGKSTLLRLLAGLERQTEGVLGIDGEELSRPYEGLGMVFQDSELLPWRTVLNNVLLQQEIRKMPRQEFRKRAHRLLESVGLEAFLDRYPDEISGGMAQRVSLCRALLHDPRLLLMDEPFGALDALTRDRMNTLLNRVWREHLCTVVLVTHSIEEAVFLAERVIVMTPRPGTIAAEIKIPFGKTRSSDLRTRAAFQEKLAEVRAALEGVGAL